MANDFFVPFNYEPTSTTNETSSYFLPAGRYAKVTPTAFGSALIADGEELVSQLERTGEATTTSTSFQTAFQNNTGVPLLCTWQHRQSVGVTGESQIIDGNGVLYYYNRAGARLSSANFQTNSTSYVSDTTNYVTEDRILWPGYTLQFKTNNSLYTAYCRYNVTPLVAVPAYSFWVSGGASGITITGDRFVIEEYTSIS
jgi:hypothetical protein